MRAIILAAGRSSRMYPITPKIPKALLELEKGVTIIEHQINMLRKCGVDDIIVVVGYLKDKFKKKLGNRVRFRNFDDYLKYNNLHTLYSVKDELDDDVVVLYSDVVFGDKLLRKATSSSEDFCLLVHNKDILEDTAKVIIEDNGLNEVGNHIPMENADGNFVGIAKFSKKGAKILVEEMGNMVGNKKHDNSYYIVAVNQISKSNHVGFEYVGGEPWIEMDFLEYYERAKNEIYPRIKQNVRNMRI